MIVVIDYGAGNMCSIEKALANVGAQVQVTDQVRARALGRDSGSHRRP